MIFSIEKISISRNELLKRDDSNLCREITDELIDNQVEGILCDIVSKIISSKDDKGD